MKCTIRAWFVNQGISIDSGEKAWNTGRVHINSFRKPLAECSPNELWKAELDIELTQLDTFATHLELITKELEALGRNDPRIQRVMSIPGVGPRTAEIIVACIDDPHRFQNGRQVSAYFGLVPRQFQSGMTDRNGRITKRGNPLARTILTECAWASLRYNPWAKAIYERISGKQKTRKKKAAIALARKIVVIAWAMLRDEKDWDPRTMIQTTESFGRMPLGLKEILQTMKPKELSQQRKNRLAREVREAKAAADSFKKDEPTPKKDASEMNSQKPASRKNANDEQPNKAKKSHAKQSTDSMKLRGARKRVPVRDA
jgi:hypothetical protein